MRGVLFSGDDFDLYILKPGLFQPLLNPAFLEAKPDITIQFAGIFEIVL